MSDTGSKRPREEAETSPEEDAQKADSDSLPTESGGTTTKVATKTLDVDKVITTLVTEVIPHPAVLSSSEFATIGRTAGTDKITHHAYHRFYPRYLEHYRKLKGMAMLEIGIDHSHSLVMWKEYFPYSFIYGIDIDIAQTGERFKIFQADQSDKTKMEKIAKKYIKEPVFFIIDDGSHIPEHQIQTFDYLFREL
jgi:hypothetical protein